MKKIFLLISTAFLMFSCGSSDKGEVIGVQERPDFLDMQPYGMVDVPQGSFLMGSSDEDVYKLYDWQPRTVQVQSFWMDETEITNNEYRQFVYWVRDSIAYKLLGVDFPETYLIEADQWGEELNEPIINWSKKIDWTLENADEREALAEMFIPVDERFYGAMQIDAKRLNYEYYWIDLRAASQKNFETTASEEYRGSSFASRPDGLNNKNKFYRREVINVYPDTLCWVHDYAYSYNDAATRSYFSHPRYDNYPVVGVSYKQAKAFSVWRTLMMNNYLAKKEYERMEDFRLPTEAEWEYAARGGVDGAPYPWGGPYVRNGNGCFIANYKPLRGNYGDDGGVTPILVAHYAPNGFGLYDMAGNVAEWTASSYSNIANTGVHDMNPDYAYTARDIDGNSMKRKVVKGGSWKDVSYYLQCGVRTYEYQYESRSYIGFRCVRSYIGN